eukprot:GHVS01008559.1.p1 GENE.GHVS01008559.1~~GHVS01008559.1.p1  ORF type:complete len:335 (+),score=40.57 GHVS01008559.1:224-1228(+)
MEMLRLLKLDGHRLMLEANDVREHRIAVGSIIAEVMEAYTTASAALTSGNLADMPSDVANSLADWESRQAPCDRKVLPDETVKFWQLSGRVVPWSERLDSWYHLLIEALKDFLASGEDWRPSNWDISMLPTDVDTSSPDFIANKLLVKELLPRFVVDYLLRQIHNKDKPTLEAPNETRDQQVMHGLNENIGLVSGQNHAGIHDKGDQDAAQNNKLVLSQNKPGGQEDRSKQLMDDLNGNIRQNQPPTIAHQDSGRTQAWNNLKGDGKSGSQTAGHQEGETKDERVTMKLTRRVTVETGFTVNMIVCTTASVTLCIMLLVYAYAVLILRRVAYPS